MFVCCEAIGAGCEQCSTWCTKSCQWLCPTDRPSPIFTIFSICINLAMLIVSIVFLVGDASKTCSTGGTCKAWYGVFVPIAIGNGCFSFYIYHRFSKELKKGKTACKTFSKFVLYDIGCYLYIWIYIFEVVWLIVGPSSMCNGESVCTQLKETAAPVALLATYLFGGIFFFLMSVVVQCCYEDPYGNQSGGGMAHAAAAAGAPVPTTMGQVAYVAMGGSMPSQSQQQNNRGVGGGFFGGSSSSSSNNNNNNNNNNNQSYNNNRHQNESSSRTAAVVAGAVASAAGNVLGAGLRGLGNLVSSPTSSNNNQEQQQQHQQQHQTHSPAYGQPQPDPYAQQPQPNNQTIYDSNKQAAPAPQYTTSPPPAQYTSPVAAQSAQAAQPQWGL